MTDHEIPVSCICCLSELGTVPDYAAATKLAAEHYPFCPDPNGQLPLMIEIDQQGEVTMPTLPTREVYGYQSHRHLPELHDYKNLKRDVGQNGVKEPVDIVTDGQVCYLEDGHKRLWAAIENQVRTLPVNIIQRPISVRRRIKYPLGEELSKLLNPAPPETEPEPAAAE